MKIVVLDGYTLNPGDLDWKGLEALGDVTVHDRTPADKVASYIGDAEIVYTNKTLITKETLDLCPNIKFIGVLATGFNIVDTDAAKARGIPVSNVPTYGTAAVSQFAFALLLEICHHVGYHSQTVIDGRWGNQDDYCYWDYPLIELAGMTMGIIGLGRIGKATAKIANAFGMNVLACDDYKDLSLESENLRYADLDELFAKSDVISLHCPLTPESTGIINAANIAKMKDGVIIINTSRGPLINEDALVAALNSGKIAGAAVDVLYTEPPKQGSVLIGAKNCIVTPHIAWAPLASRRRLMNIAVDNLKQFLAGSPVNVVNP